MNSVSTSECVYVLVVRTSMMYGRLGLGRIYGTYRELGCSLRNYTRKWSSQSQFSVTKFRCRQTNIHYSSFPHSQPSAEDISFSVAFHEGTGIGWRVNAESFL